MLPVSPRDSFLKKWNINTKRHIAAWYSQHPAVAVCLSILYFYAFLFFCARPVHMPHLPSDRKYPIQFYRPAYLLLLPVTNADPLTDRCVLKTSDEQGLMQIFFQQLTG